MARIRARLEADVRAQIISADFEFTEPRSHLSKRGPTCERGEFVCQHAQRPRRNCARERGGWRVRTLRVRRGHDSISSFESKAKDASYAKRRGESNLSREPSAELLRKDFTGARVAVSIPMAVAEVAAETVQEDLVLVRISLQLRRERDDGDTFTLAERADAHVWIKNICRADFL